MERCPCCKARLGGASQCPRCQAELGGVIGAGQAAQFWLGQALQWLEENKTEQSLHALERSLRLKKTRLAVAVRDFLIHRQGRLALELLAQNQLLPAKHQLYKVRHAVPRSPLLQHTNAFTDYLLAKQQDTANRYSAANPEFTEAAGGLLDLSEADQG